MPTITVSAPEKLIVSENGIAKSEPQKSESETDKLLKANATLAVWLVFFTIGGGLLALYYSQIHYLPEIEWKAALIYLFIGSMVGGVIGLLLTIALLIPGVLWSEHIIFDPCLDFFYTVPRGELPGKEPDTELCIRSITRYLGRPFLKVLLFSHLALLAGKFLYWPFAIVILVKIFRFMQQRFRNLLVEKNACTDELILNRKAFKCSFWFTLSCLLSQISMYVIYWLSDSPGELFFWYFKNAQKLGIFIVLTLLCTTGVLLSSHSVAALYRHHPRRAVVASLVAAGLLLFTADNFSSLSMKLMKHYGIGYGKRVNLLVTKNGEDIAYRLGAPKCVDLQLCNVEILSKVGDEYFLRVGDTAYITLPKAEVVAIRPLN